MSGIDARLLHDFAGRAAEHLPGDLQEQLRVLAAQAWQGLLDMRKADEALQWELLAPGKHRIDGVLLACPYRALDAVHQAIAGGSCDVRPFVRPGSMNAGQIVRRSLRRECATWATLHVPQLVPLLLAMPVEGTQLRYVRRRGGPRIVALGSSLVREADSGATTPDDHGTNQPQGTDVP